MSNHHPLVFDSTARQQAELNRNRETWIAFALDTRALLDSCVAEHQGDARYAKKRLEWWDRALDNLRDADYVPFSRAPTQEGPTLWDYKMPAQLPLFGAVTEPQKETADPWQERSAA